MTLCHSLPLSTISTSVPVGYWPSTFALRDAVSRRFSAPPFTRALWAVSAMEARGERVRAAAAVRPASFLSVSCFIGVIPSFAFWAACLTACINQTQGRAGALLAHFASGARIPSAWQKTDGEPLYFDFSVTNVTILSDFLRK